MGLSGVIAQHELPITGVSKQKPAGHSLVQVGGDWTTGAQSTSSSLSRLGLWFPWGLSPRQGMVLGRARGQVSRRERAWRGSRICLGPLQGSVDTHRVRQGHFLLASHGN